MESTLFQHAAASGVRLIETLGWDGAQLVRLDRHLARLAQGAALLGYICDLDAARASLLAAGQGKDDLQSQRSCAALRGGCRTWRSCRRPSVRLRSRSL